MHMAGFDVHLMTYGIVIWSISIIGSVVTLTTAVTTGHFNLNGTREKSENTKLILIDTDPGGDDAWAIFMALARQQSRHFSGHFRVVGITTVSGNTNIGNVTRNSVRVLHTVGDTLTPIFKGVAAPMISPFFNYVQDPPYFGFDGFGDVDLEPIYENDNVQAGDAVNSIIRYANLYQGQLTLVCLGPLTNLAMSLKLEPRISKWLKEVFIMGGSTNGAGIVGPYKNAEFNFFVDPEAAHLVLTGLVGVPKYILPWNVVLEHAPDIEFRTETLGHVFSPVVQLMNQVEWKHLQDNNNDYWITSDSMLMACVIDSNVMQKVTRELWDVELTGSVTRGTVAIDNSGRNSSKPNVSVILKINKELYEEMLFKTVLFGVQ